MPVYILGIRKWYFNGWLLMLAYAFFWPLFGYMLYRILRNFAGYDDD